MPTMADVERAWRECSPLAVDHMLPQVADLLVLTFEARDRPARVVDLAGGLVGVEVLGPPGTAPTWSHIVGLVEGEGWWMLAEHPDLVDQPPVVMLGTADLDAGLELVEQTVPRLERVIPMDGAITLAELNRMVAGDPVIY